MSDAKPLDGRVILVAGAAGGLGSAASVACAQAGATVVLLGRKVAPLNRVYDAAKAVGPEPLLYPLDLVGATPDDFDELAQRIQAELGRLDGLLHCAAEFKGLTPLLHTDPADFARAIHVDLTARWWLTQACLPLVAKSDAGAVVFAIDDPARGGSDFNSPRNTGMLPSGSRIRNSSRAAEAMVMGDLSRSRRPGRGHRPRRWTAVRRRRRHRSPAPWP